jgi:hypothetical protein
MFSSYAFAEAARDKQGLNGGGRIRKDICKMLSEHGANQSRSGMFEKTSTKHIPQTQWS